MLDWLSLLTLPACAVASALVVGVIHRHDELEDGALLRRFIVGVFIAFGLLYQAMQMPVVQLRLHPELQLKADIEAQPIYKALADSAPEYVDRFRAVLASEHATSATLAQARLQARSMLTALATARLQFSDQSSHVAWGQVTLDSLRELQARSPDACYAALSGQALDRETLADGFSAQNTVAFDAAVIQILESSAAFLQPSRKGSRRERPDAERPADFNATMREWQGIEDEVARVFNPEVSALLTKHRFPKSPPASMSAETVCSARIYELGAMLQRPKATAALLMDATLR